jgi:hypothetical protein
LESELRARFFETSEELMLTGAASFGLGSFPCISTSATEKTPDNPDACPDFADEFSLANLKK